MRTLGNYIFIASDSDLYEQGLIDKKAVYFDIGAVDLAYNIALRTALRVIRWGNGEEFLKNICFMDCEGIKLNWLRTNPTIRVILNAGVVEDWTLTSQTEGSATYTVKTTPRLLSEFQEVIRKYNLNTV